MNSSSDLKNKRPRCDLVNFVWIRWTICRIYPTTCELWLSFERFTRPLSCYVSCYAFHYQYSFNLDRICRPVERHHSAYRDPSTTKSPSRPIRCVNRQKIKINLIMLVVVGCRIYICMQVHWLDLTRKRGERSSKK